MIEADAIIAAAEARAGLPDPERHLHANLRALVASMNGDGMLSDDGRTAAHRNLLARTVDRLEGLKWLRDHPEIGEERIVEPLFLTGLPRSGTTYFQYLFDRDPRFRNIRTWESLMPNPPPGVDSESVARRKAEEAERRRHMRVVEIEGFDALHLIDEDGSDECHAFLEQAYAAAGFFNLYDVPAYFSFLMDELDLAAAYRVHRRQLQLLQWRMPERRWSLKYPNHVIGMDAILSVYPDARFAMTHRDPVQALASIAKMTLTLRGARYGQAVDAHRIGRQMLLFIRRHVDRIMAFCTGPHRDRVVHVDYYALVANPAATVAQAHAGLGIDTPDEVRAAIAGWRRENPKNKRGANDYALAQFGLDQNAVAELFGDYVRHFDIPREQEGLARATGLS